MLDWRSLKRQWRDLPSYERFEQVVSRIVMLIIAIIIVYAIGLTVISLYEHMQLGSGFLASDILQDVFGSILTILILIEFNHSIATAVTQRTGVLQARIIVLIAILVIARKLILLDFGSAGLDKMLGIAAVALAFGGLYWLISTRPHHPSGDKPEPPH